jgi:ATP-dependent 26S proteasome regulatory subunit
VCRSLLRPGRLEEHVQLHLPDAQERLNLFRNFIVTLPTAMKDTEGFLATLSERSAGWTPAEIKHYVTEASMRAIRVHIESCSSEWTSDSSVVVTERDFS